MSERPPTQIGGSDRGPAELDEAKKNQGVGRDAVTKKAGEDEALSSGRTARSEEDAGRKGVERTSPPEGRDPITERKKL